MKLTGPSFRNASLLGQTRPQRDSVPARIDTICFVSRLGEKTAMADLSKQLLLSWSNQLRKPFKARNAIVAGLCSCRGNATAALCGVCELSIFEQAFTEAWKNKQGNQQSWLSGAPRRHDTERQTTTLLSPLSMSFAQAHVRHGPLDAFGYADSMPSTRARVVGGGLETLQDKRMMKKITIVAQLDKAPFEMQDFSPLNPPKRKTNKQEQGGTD